MQRDTEAAIFTFYVLEHSAPLRTSLLSSKHFRDPALGNLWAAEYRRQVDNIPKPLDLPTEILSRCGDQQFVTSRYEVHDIERQMVARYQVREAWRALSAITEDIEADKWTTPEDIFSKARTEISRLESEGIDRAPSLRQIKNIVFKQASERRATGREATIPMPLYSLQHQLHGWVVGKLHLIGAVTSGYKTSFARMASETAAKAGKRVLYWTAEDTGLDIAYRSFAANTRASTRTFLEGDRLGDELLGECTADIDSAYNERILALDNPRPRLSHLLARVRFEFYQHGVDVFVFDFLQLIAKDDKRQTENTFWIDCCNDLAALAKELDIVILATVQVTQEATKKQLGDNGGWLTLGDLRGGSAIAQAAYGVLLIQNVKEKGAQCTYIQTAKWKSGAKSYIKLTADGAHDTLEEIHETERQT